MAELKTQRNDASVPEFLAGWPTRGDGPTPRRSAR
jgi:hypothetical protein